MALAVADDNKVNKRFPFALDYCIYLFILQQSTKGQSLDCHLLVPATIRKRKIERK